MLETYLEVQSVVKAAMRTYLRGEEFKRFKGYPALFSVQGFAP
jgi:hypothetical protein